MGVAPEVHGVTWDRLDRYFMARALDLARTAARLGEVPVGAVLVRDQQVLAEGFNRTLSWNDPCAHAEIVVLRKGARRIGNHRLVRTTLYATLEPCPMCAGALIQARVERLVFAAADPRIGSAGSVFDILGSPDVNHRCRCDSGLMEAESAGLLRDFFKVRRN